MREAQWWQRTQRIEGLEIPAHQLKSLPFRMAGIRPYRCRREESDSHMYSPINPGSAQKGLQLIFQ